EIVLPRRVLNGDAEQVVAKARIERAGAGLEDERIVLEELQRLGEARIVPRVVEFLVCPLAHAALVAQQLPAGERPLLLRISRHVTLNGRVEVQLALGRELQDRRRGEGLRERRQPVYSDGRRGNRVHGVGIIDGGRVP